MKNLVKNFVIILFTLIIGFSMTVCQEDKPEAAEKSLVSITVTKNPTKMKYTTSDSAFDSTGMIVTATYDDGSKEAVIGYTVKGFSSVTPGPVTLTISYEGKSTTLIINVENPALQTVATPVASPAAGAITSGTKVSISCSTSGAEIWYTTNGNTPAKNGTGSIKYTTSITINSAITIKAIAFKDGMNNSLMLTAAYTVSSGPQGEILVSSYGEGAYNTYTKNFTGSKRFDIVNLPDEDRDYVMKISNPASWFVASQPLLNASGINITVTFSAEVKRVGSAGELKWQINAGSSYPTVGSSISNAAANTWHTMSGTWSGTPSNNNWVFYLNADSNKASTVYYIDNLVITVTGNGYIPPSFPEPNPDLTLPSLKAAYSSYFPIGNIIDSIYIGEPYFSLLKHHYSVVTPGNNLKPSYLAPEAKGGSYKWTEADDMVDKAISNGFVVFGHTLVWHRQTPDWMTQGTQSQAQENLTSYITAVLNHFKNRISEWDVANEIFRDDLSGVTASTDWKTCLRTDAPWYVALGAEYIELAYRTARIADPSVTLYYNDYSMDNQNKARAVANMIRDINQKYKNEGNSRNLIEGIGMQSHYQTANWFSVSNVAASLDMFIGLGIKVAISELDIRISDYKEGAKDDSVMTSADAQAQANLYKELFGIYKARAANISRVSMWGMDDYNSWLSVSNPCLFDRNLTAKPAFHAIKNP